MNPLLAQDAPAALIALEDGTVLKGLSVGAAGETFGEIVFNTSLSGYQEVITDPSYAGQVVIFTYPQIGNYGIDPSVSQAPHPALAGVVVRDMCHTPSNWTSTASLPDYLAAEGIVAIEGVDTRELTLRVRDRGTMRCAISTVDLDPDSLVARVVASPSISQTNWVAATACDKPFDVASRELTADEKPLHVVALDCGQKAGIIEGLVAAGLDVTVVPWDTTADDILAYEPDGVFLSNGPGDPREVGEPATCARELLGRVPVFGICLGHQMICQAAGATIDKLPFGHHSGNQPVMNLLSGMVEVTAQNHNYGLNATTLGDLDESCCSAELASSWKSGDGDMRLWSAARIAPVFTNERFGRVRVTHVNLNDGTPEGIQFMDIPAYCVQYHPEACPGPHDAAYLFRAFRRLMEGVPDYLDIDVREGRRF